MVRHVLAKPALPSRVPCCSRHRDKRERGTRGGQPDLLGQMAPGWLAIPAVWVRERKEETQYPLESEGTPPPGSSLECSSYIVQLPFPAGELSQGREGEG